MQTHLLKDKGVCAETAKQAGVGATGMAMVGTRRRAGAVFHSAINAGSPDMQDQQSER